MSALVFAVAFIPIPELEGLGQAAAGAITRSITQNIVNAGKVRLPLLKILRC